MFASRLFWRVMGTCLLLVVLSALLLSSVVAQRQQRNLEARLSERLFAVSEALRVQFAFGEDSGFHSSDSAEQLNELASRTDLKILIINEIGKVLVGANDSLDEQTNGVDLTEFRTARKNGRGSTRRHLPESGLTMMYSAVRVGTEDDPLGYIRVGSSIERIDAQVAQTQRLVWMIAGLIAVVAMGFLLLLIGRVLAPLRELTIAAQQISRGEFVRTNDVPAGDEFASLTKAFNAMSDELANRIALLQRSQRELQENSELQETVLATMIEGVVVVDEKERVIFSNRAAGALLETGASAMVGRPIWEVARHLTLQEVVRAALNGEAQRDVEFVIPRNKSVVAMTASRLPGDPCPGAVLVLHDVTKLRRLENMRRDFVSNVSHELKTPLTSIRAFTETLLDGAIDDATHNREFLQRIQEQAERLHILILDVLNLARIESEESAFSIVPVSLVNAIRECAEQHRAIAEQKQLDLELDLPDDEIQLMADREGLRTILDNLVGNAINYTPSGGQVIIRGFATSDRGYLQVEDTGVGIPREHQERIFERFYRVDRARSREIGGTGLGLSIVKHLTQVFGGDIEVDSEPGKGTLFTVSFCLASSVVPPKPVPPLH